MTVQLITREGCPKCEEAKKRLRDAGVEFEALVIGEDIARATVIENYPEARSLPVIIIDGRQSSLESALEEDSKWQTP